MFNRKMTDDVLVVVFSRAGENYFGGSLKRIEKGNSLIAAEMIKKYLSCDLYEMEMKVPYSEDYQECIKEAKEDLNNNRMPEIANPILSISKYDTIILVYPNYWGTIPMVVKRFLTSYNFQGKKILPLCTNEGSGMGHSVSDIQKFARGADVENGLPVSGSQVREAGGAIEHWLNGNKLGGKK